MKIKVKYFSNEINRLEQIDIGNWIDLRSTITLHINEGESAVIPLGIAMELPEGYEAHVVPRSSTFKNFGVIQTNHFGVIDYSYCGDNDQWFMPVYAVRDTIIYTNDRICQFRICKIQPDIEFEEVDILGNDDRGGYGSTGIK